MSVFRSTSNCQHLGFLPEGFICHPIFFSPYTPMQAGSAGESSPSLYHWQMGVDGSEAQLTHCSGRITLRSVSCVVYRRPFSGLSSSYSMCRNLFDNVPFIDSLAVPVSLLRFLANISWGQLHNKWLVLKRSSWHLLLGECKLRQLVWAVIWGNRSLRWILEPHQMAINKSHRWWLRVWW